MCDKYVETFALFTHFNYNLLMSNVIPYIREEMNEKLDVWQIQTIFNDIPSTNTYLKEQAQNLSDKTIVHANKQSSGRGRYQRQFKSTQDKGIFCSFLMKNYDPQSLTQLSFACALALAITIEELYQLHVQIKWPNDLILNSKKLAGILIETMHQAETMDVIIGFGLNVYHQDFGELSAISLEDAYHSILDRNLFIVHFFKIFENLLKTENILTLYRKWMVPRGEVITTSIQGIKTEVMILDAQENGSLLVKKEDGTELTLFNEEIQILSSL